MEGRKGSSHLKPHPLPPLVVGKISNEYEKIIPPNSAFDKPLRQRIGTPAPQKKSPIPDDLDLDNLDVKCGNPAIKVESCKPDDMQRKKYHILPEKTLRSVLEDVPSSGNNILNCRLPKKTHLQPIMNPIFNVKNQDDLNGNNINERLRPSDMKMISSEGSIDGKMHLPSKYNPLKPIVRRSDFD